MRVTKRDGVLESVSFDKVLQRIRKASKGLAVNPDALAQQVLARIVDRIKTSELDELTAQMAASLCTTHPDWGTLASRIAVSNHQKNTEAAFSKVVERLADQRGATGEPMSYLSEELVAFVKEHGEALDAYIKHERDYEFDYFGFKTLEKAYLLRDTARVVLERPQHMWMRVAVGIWGGADPAIALDRVKETYDLLSQKFMTHATPTLFNAGSPRPQLSSCFVAGTLVHTMNGVKPIETVELGDLVVTHTGEVKPVTQLHTNPLGDRQVFTLKVAGTPSIKVTGNHRLWSISDEQERWGKSPGWNAVDYLRTGDWVMIPEKSSSAGDIVIDIKDYLHDIRGDANNILYSYRFTEDKVYPSYTYTRKRASGEVTCTKKGNSFNRFWKFDKQMMELLGIWYGDGCVVHAKNSSGEMFPRSINIVSHYKNEKLMEFVNTAFHNCLGVEHVTLSTDATGLMTMTVNNTIIAHLFKSLFKCKFDGKRLPAFFNELSREHIEYFLAGLVSSDGCVSKGNSVVVQLTNSPLVNDIFHLARSVGIPITLTMMTSRTSKATGRMSIPQYVIAGKVKKHYQDERLDELDNYDSSTWNQVRRIDGKMFMRINGKEPCVEHHDIVYTLGVEDCHSYSVGGIIAENCYLLAMADDSISGIYKTLGDCAAISKYAGGIGLHVHNIRARGSLIRGTNGTSNGLVPMLRVFNNTARYVDQGGGKRNGSFAIYLEPWHADVEDFLRMKLNSGAEEERARDLFYALWIPDLFMRRVEEDAEWSLFCPAEAPGLADVWGAEFDALYTRYEREGRARKTVSARKLWFQVLDTQMETGTPYLLYKDAANGKSNQQNLGTIKSSNLCVEIMEYSSPEETAVCNLASIALPAFVTIASAGRLFDFEGLQKVVRAATRNLNRVIDINFYPTPETRRSNMRHRPIGLGIQGLADVFAMLGLAWESPEAADLNQRIFEHIYFAALTESAAAAAVDGPYETFSGSPASKGLLQFDLWTSPEGVPVKPLTDASLPWDDLKAKIQATGLRNSLLVAPMPTASTSQILGYNECFEPFTTNLYTRRTLAGEFIVVNKYLTKELMDLGLWSDEMKQRIVAANGSVQDIAEIPEAVRARFKTAWEIPQKVLIDMAAARGAFVCQSQSLNLFVPEPTYSKLTSMHFYAWKKGLKSGCYYLRTKAPVAAQKFTIDPRLLAAVNGPTGPAGPADDADSVVSDDSELTDDEAPVAPSVPSAPAQETRTQKLERLAREYEEEVARAKAAADAGEGCLYCSA